MAQLLSYFIILIIMLSFISCYSTLQEDPLRHYNSDQESGYDSQAYPSYLSTIDDGAFKNLIQQRSDVLSLRKFDRVGSISSSGKTVNVNDYGAKGDGSDDDTEVLFASLTYSINGRFYSLKMIHNPMHECTHQENFT